MADSTPATIDPEVLAKALGAAISQGLNAHQPRKVEFGEYDERWRKGRPTLTRECFQTGFPLDEDSLSPETINLFNRVSRSGLYLDKLVEVTIREEGGGRQSVHLMYNNARPDQRNEILRRVPSLEAMLQRIVDAQDKENAEDEREREVKRQIREGGTFGNNKAYREAKAAADARA